MKKIYIRLYRKLNRDADSRRKRRFFFLESAKISVFQRPKKVLFLLPIKSILNRQAFELTHVQMMEEAFRVQQLLMRALLHDLTVFNDDDFISVANGG